jgi:hypothetical protein
VELSKYVPRQFLRQIAHENGRSDISTNTFAFLLTSYIMRSLEQIKLLDLENRDIQIVYICFLLSNTPFIRPQNGSKLQ